VGYCEVKHQRRISTKITVGLDIGKYYSHWTKLVTHGNAIGHIVDYGIMETPGLSATSDELSIETAILKSSRSVADRHTKQPTA
jgi:hypothetical protein